MRELTVRRETLAQYHLSDPLPGVSALACHDIFTLVLLQPLEFIDICMNEGSNFVLHPFRNENRKKYWNTLPGSRTKWEWLSDPKWSAKNFVAELQSPKVIGGESPGDVRTPEQMLFLRQEHFMLCISIAVAMLPISLTLSALAFLCALEGVSSN